MTKMNFNKLVEKITNAVVDVANEIMSDAAEDIRQKAGNPDGPVNTRGSVDGAWQRRGFSSLNGNMATVSLGNGKVLDVEPLSRHCRQCKSKASLKVSNIDLYNEWYEKQQKNCTLNYQSSAGIMEVVGSKVNI